MNEAYRVVRMLESMVEQEVNAAYVDGWEVVAAFVARFMYGLGGEYQAKEVEVIYRRRVLEAPSAPA